MKIGFVPIDNRPVCYTLPKLIADINSDCELFMPAREYLGGLLCEANVEYLFNFIKSRQNLDCLILSLDTLIYGGLISSRRSDLSLEEISLRLARLKNILKEKNCKIFAFSSIMRISNNNINEEEKEYWNVWGKKIFEYSYQTDKNGTPAKTDVPDKILNDYLETRKRNFEVNKIYLQWQKEGIFDTLIFSKDDCAQYGLNVIEARKLKELGGFVKTGADEIPLSLLSRAFTTLKIPVATENFDDVRKIKIYPIYIEDNCKNLISNYEDISIEESVAGQIILAGCEVAKNFQSADIILIVNNFKNNQGEIVMKIPTESFSKYFEIPQKPFMIADVRFANGSDNTFVEKLFAKQDFYKLVSNYDFLGYAGWNTSANTIGSLIAGGLAKFMNKNFDKHAFAKLELTRFLDDWAYQANVRQKLKFADVNDLRIKMKAFEQRLGVEGSISYKFPWKRLFEVEVEFN